MNEDVGTFDDILAAGVPCGWPPFLSLFGKFGTGYTRRVTDELVEQIRNGVAPWQKPWEPGKSFVPENFSTGRRYTAGNSVYLMSQGIKQGFGDNRWGTSRQIEAGGGHVYKDEKATQVLFWTQQKSRFITRLHTVFNIQQEDGISLQSFFGQPPPVVVRGHACASQFSRPADLGASHVVFKVVSLFPGRFVPVGACDVEPHVREHGILENALAIVVHDPEVELRLSDTLLGSELEPAYRFGIVLENALPVVVHDPEVVLRFGVSLVGSLPDSVEIVLCQEHHDGEATRHEHSSSHANQPWHFVYRLQMGGYSPLSKP